MKKINSLICLFLLMVSGITSAQELDSLVNYMAEKNSMDCGMTDRTGKPSRLFLSFERLKSIATKEELIALTDHKSRVVMAYSAYALLDRELIDPEKLIEKFIPKKASVWIRCGCLFSGFSLSAVAYGRYWRLIRERPTDNMYSTILKHSRKLQRMDSLIQYAKSPYSEGKMVMRPFKNRVYSNEYKTRVEAWAFEELDFAVLKYVFDNLKEGNEERLKKAFRQFINEDKNSNREKRQVVRMLKKLQK